MHRPDCTLYLAGSGTDDPNRRATAHAPGDATIDATLPLARAMIERSIAIDMPFA